MLEVIDNKNRLKLPFWLTVGHYMIVPFFLIVPTLTAYDLFTIYVTNTYEGVRSATELTRASIPFLALALLMYFIQRRQLTFKEIDISFTDEQFQEAIKRTADDLEWEIKHNTKNHFQAYRHWNWTGSWGEMITIVRQKNKLLVNSICDPHVMSSVISYGWNKKNINTFLSNLTASINNVPAKVKIDNDKPENEWTIKKIAIRLFAYPTCLMFITVGTYAIFHPVDIRSTIAAIGVIVIAIAYFYYDIQVLRTHKSRQQKT